MRYSLFGIILLTLLQIGCKKANDWLNVPRTKQDITFSQLKDYQALLNNTAIFNSNLPTIGLIGSDNIYVADKYISNLPVVERNSYLWNKEIYEGKPSFEYNFAYQAINYSNVVLNGIEGIDISSANFSEYQFIKGQAHFFRALNYFELASLYCKPYFSETAKVDKGLCLRTNSDINEIVKRSTVSETYKLIIEDLLSASKLLPEKSTIKTQPSKIAAYLLLARIYLNMSNFISAKIYADSCLKLSNTLIDFNNIPNINLPFRFPDFKGQNEEVLFYAKGIQYQTIYPSDVISSGLVDTSLFREYDTSDLRRLYFFRQFDSVTIKFKGTYTGTSSHFCGLGVNEAFLVRAECNARIGNLTEAIDDINLLLRKRYLKGKYLEFSSNSQEEVLNKVLLERRKELPITGMIRWQDLRRMNLEPSLATSIYRMNNSILIELKPNDVKYVFPFPQSEINLTGIEQNIR